MATQLHNKIEELILSKSYEVGEDDEYSISRTTSIASFYIFLICCFYAPLYLFFGNSLAFWSATYCGVCSFLALLCLRLRLSSLLASSLLIQGIVICLCLIILSTGGLFSAVNIWMVSASILLSFFIFKKRNAYIFSFLTVLATCVVLVFSFKGMSYYGFSFERGSVYGISYDFIVIVSAQLLSILLVGIFKETEQVYRKKLQESQSLIISQEKYRSIGEVAGGIAHEVNNPLAILSSSGVVIQRLLNKGKCTEKDIDTFIERSNSAIDRIRKIVAGLRSVSESPGEETLNIHTFNEILNDVLPLYQEKFKSSEVELEVIDVKEAGFLEVKTAKSQLNQVLVSLLNNAYDSILPLQEKWIKIFVLREGVFLHVKVIDSGKGIPKENQEAIFQPFFSTKEIGKGTGLGLSVSRSFLRKQSGDLYLDKNSMNTSFVISLPIA